MIKGIEKLTREQIELMKKVNQMHSQAMGKDAEVIETWVDDDGLVCVRLADGEWYHYTEQGQWY